MKTIAHTSETAAKWLENCLILDTETTGLDSSAEIVEISIIDQDGNIVMDTLVKPTQRIPEDAIRIHGITNEMVASAPSWPDIQKQFIDIVKFRELVIYNASYDERLILQTAYQHGDPELSIPANIHCAMELYAEFHGDWNDYRGNYRWQGLIKAAGQMELYAEFHGDWNDYRGNYRWQGLIKAAGQMGVTIEGEAHRALSDCLTTLGVLKAMTEQTGEQSC